MEVLAGAVPAQRASREAYARRAVRAPHFPAALFAVLMFSCGGSSAGQPVRVQSAADHAPASKPPSQLQLARHAIKHVVFVVKENRTFDTMFGRFPGADGATRG